MSVVVVFWTQVCSCILQVFVTHLLKTRHQQAAVVIQGQVSFWFTRSTPPVWFLNFFFPLLSSLLFFLLLLVCCDCSWKWQHTGVSSVPAWWEVPHRLHNFCTLSPSLLGPSFPEDGAQLALSISCGGCMCVCKSKAVLLLRGCWSIRQSLIEK